MTATMEQDAKTAKRLVDVTKQDGIAVIALNDPPANTYGNTMVGDGALDSGGTLEVASHFWRPSVSTIFCLPVKNGWHCEQISTW